MVTHPIHGVIHISQFILDIKFEHDPVLLSEVEWHEDDGCASDLAAKPASQVAVLVVGVRLVASAKNKKKDKFIYTLFLLHTRKNM